jgi:cell pole-organizing protein PopZ
MPQAEGQPEQPSMEEILASIRRIIAEDAATPSAAPAASSPAAGAAAPEQDVLELTEMVKDDGTVVSISAGAAKAPPPPAPELKLTAGNMFQKKPASSDAATRVEPPLPAEAAPPPPPRVDVSIEMGAPPKRVEAKPVPPIHAGEASLAPLELTEPEPETPPPSAAAPAEDRIVSGAAAAASVAALSRLADLGQHGIVSKEPLGESGRTLESLVRELLRPMLKHWLDDHLPSMVERLVREEIQRMTRDAQGR